MSIFLHDGTAWQEINDLKRYADGTWQAAELSRFNGTEWELIWPCHFEYTVHYSPESFVVFQEQGEKQVSSSNILTGTKYTNTADYYYDSLLFFPMEQIRNQLASVQLISAVLSFTVTSIYSERTFANITPAYCLSGVDPTSDSNTWERDYTPLINPTASGNSSHYLEVRPGASSSVSVDPSVISSLLNSTADCLCFPTPQGLKYNTSGYAVIDPDSVSLSITYIT